MATSALTAPPRRPRLRPLVARAALGGAVLVASLGLTAAGAAAAPAAAGAEPAPSTTREAVVGAAVASAAHLSTADGRSSPGGATLLGPAAVSAPQTGRSAVSLLAAELQIAATGPVAARLDPPAARPLPAEVSVGPAPSGANHPGDLDRPTLAAVALGRSLAASSALLQLADAALPGAPRTAPAPTPAAGPSPGTGVVGGVEPGQRPGSRTAAAWRSADEVARALPAAAQRAVERVVQRDVLPALEAALQRVVELGTGTSGREAGWAQQPGRGSLVGQSGAVVSLLAACGLVAAVTVGRRQEGTRS